MNPASPENPSRLVSKVWVRRDGEALGEFPTRSLIPNIQKGVFQPTDEFSGDGRHWTVLGRHHQLSRYFETQPAGTAPGLDRELGDLAALLKEINQG